MNKNNNNTIRVFQQIEYKTRNNKLPYQEYYDNNNIELIKKDGILFCPACNEYIQRVVEDFGETFYLAIECSCIKKFEEDKKENAINQKYVDKIPPEYRGVYLKDLEEPIPFVSSFIENFKTDFLPNAKGLHLYGSKGTGKTYACRCIINELARQKVNVFAISFIDLIELHLNYKDYETLESTKNKIKHAELIFLDDVGANRESDFVVEKINKIIDHLYTLKKSIIITTNISRKDLANNQSQDIGRAYDRLVESCHPILMAGESYRVKKAIKDKDKFDKILNLN